MIDAVGQELDIDSFPKRLAEGVLPLTGSQSGEAASSGGR